MLDRKALKAEIAKKGFSQKELARRIGMSESAFYSRMQRGIFGTDEIERLVLVLKLERPWEIFLRMW